jgi:hypothetical protein
MWMVIVWTSEGEKRNELFRMSRSQIESFLVKSSGSRELSDQECSETEPKNKENTVHKLRKDTRAMECEVWACLGSNTFLMLTTLID